MSVDLDQSEVMVIFGLAAFISLWIGVGKLTTGEAGEGMAGVVIGILILMILLNEGGMI